MGAGEVSLGVCSSLAPYAWSEPIAPVGPGAIRLYGRNKSFVNRRLRGPKWPENRSAGRSLRETPCYLGFSGSDASA